MKIYKTKFDKTFACLYFGLALFLLSFPTYSFYCGELAGRESALVALCFLLIIAIIIIPSFLLKIKLCSDLLIVNIGFDIFKLNISDVTKIRIGETMWSGLHKYGTSTKGLIVFSKYKNDLYITPENQDDFINEVLKINPQIIIDDVRK